jgi:site-specific recombinase XerC
MTALAPTLQAFFTDRLMSQRQASRHTIAAYRDTFRLLLDFAATRAGRPPSTMDIADLDASLVAAFLDDLETRRATASAPATPAYARSTPCSATRRCATPNTPRSSNVCWPSHPNASTAT